MLLKQKVVTLVLEMEIDKSFTKVKDKEIRKCVTILNKYLINGLKHPIHASVRNCGHSEFVSTTGPAIIYRTPMHLDQR